MRKTILLSIMLFSFIFYGAMASAEWSIVATYEVPEGASGLAYDGEYLYCGIYGSNGDEIYQIDPGTGDYQLSFSGPQEDAYGLTYDGEYLWTTDHPNNPAVAMQMDWSGTLLSQFNLPDRYMSGIAYDNGDFWVATYYPDPSTIYKVDSTGTILHQFTAPDNQPWDLCLENDYLWMADYWGDALYKIDKENGTLVESHDSEGSDPAGIVYDGTYLWYCDNGQGGVDYLYKVDLGGAGTPEIAIGFEEHDFGNTIIGEADSVGLSITNNGTAPLEVSDLTFSAEQYSALPEPPIVIEPGVTETVMIYFAPDDWGFFPATLTIESNDPVNPTEEVSLNGYGIYGTQEIHITNDMITLSNIRAGAYTSRKVEVANVGAEDLVIDEITLSDSAHFFLDEAVMLPITLSTRDTTYIRFWFRSDEVGTYACDMEIYSNDEDESPSTVQLSGTTTEYSTDLGTQLWNYQTNFDYEKIIAMKNFVDLNGDGIAEVIIADDDYGVHCVNGNSSGVADTLWYFNTHAPLGLYGSIYQEQGLTTIPDVNDDGIDDVIAGTAWGNKTVYAIDGSNGELLWHYDTHIYGEGGWVYEVDAGQDYNGDGINDVLAAVGAGDDETIPKGVFLLDGTDGSQIWFRNFGHSQYGVSSMEDINGDGIPEAVSGGAEEKIRLLNGDTGFEIFSYNVGETVWAITSIMDADGDDLEDICCGTTDGRIIARSSQNDYLWQFNTGGSYIGPFSTAIDPAGQEYVLYGVLGASQFALLNSSTGQPLWYYNTGGYILDSSPASDFDADDHFEVLLGTLADEFIALSGMDGSVLYNVYASNAVEQTLGIDDLDESNTPEILYGDRNGFVVCLATGEQEPSFIAGSDVNSTPERVSISNYPNPFNPTTTIQFNIPSKTDVMLSIYDISGKLIKTMVNEELESGYHTVKWSGDDETGKAVSSGMYVYRLDVNGETYTRRCILLK